MGDGQSHTWHKKRISYNHNKLPFTFQCEEGQWTVLSQYSAGLFLVQSGPRHARSSTPYDQNIILDFTKTCNG